MNNVMRQLCLNKAILFILITAILFLQCSTSHIHLASEHEHDGGQHQHTVAAHQHQLDSHHADVIDVADDTLAHADNNKVIELEHVCTQYHGNLAKLFVVIPSMSRDCSGRQLSFKSIVSPSKLDSFQAYHQYSSIRLRAPPTNS